MAENNTKQDEAKIRREKQSDMSRRSSWHFCKTGRVFLIAITLIFAISCMTACKSTPCGNGSNGACKTLREAAETPKTKDKKKTEND